MTNPFQELVEKYQALLEEGQSLASRDLSPPERPSPSLSGPSVLLFSPHPDDECVIGGLPLRLLREGKMNVVNVAVTLGSRRDRRRERWQELQAACGVLGFKALTLREDGLEGITPVGRREHPEAWRQAVELVTDLIRRLKPRFIFLPHRRDGNQTHVGSHALVIEAIRNVGKGLTASYVIETEYWSTMDSPNLLVESSAEDVADLLFALACHVGEVRRNPYYLTLPAWMQDNVRRGGELVGGQGGAAPDFVFCTLYRLRRWTNGGLLPTYAGGRNLAAGASVSALFA